MTDEEIVNLYWERSERAISETDRKYGKYCHTIAYNILKNREDSSECVNDTYFKAWKSMPDCRPRRLMAFLGKITRTVALNKYDFYTAQKRGGSETSAALDELLECVSGDSDGNDVADEIFLRDVLNSFLGKLDDDSRNIFICRYWYMYSSKEIAAKYGFTVNKVDVSLCRARSILKSILIKEGLY